MIILKNNNFTRKAFSDLLFFFGYAVYLIFSIIKITFYYKYIPNSIFKIMMLLVTAIMISGELFQKKYKLKEVAAMFLALSLTCLAIFRITGQIEFLPLFITLFCVRNKNAEKLIKVTTVIGLFMLAIIVLGSKIGIVEDYTTYGKNSFGVRIRHYLGFRYALYPSAVLYNFMSLDLYARRYDKSIKVRGLIWGLICYWFYAQTVARLSFYFSLCTVIIAIFYKEITAIIEKIKKVLIPLCTSFILSTILSFYVAIKYTPKNPIMHSLNVILEERLRLGQDAFIKYGIKLFGTKVAFVGNGLSADGRKMTGVYNYVDSFYLNILIKYGIVFLILVVLGYTIASIYSYKKNDYFMLILLVILAFHGLIDDLILYISFNSLWIIIPIAVYNYNNDLIRIKNIIKQEISKIKRKKVRIRL